VAKTLLAEKLPYDPERDFTPVTRVATGAAILVVHPSVPARTLKEFIALGRAHPGKLFAASAGFGSISHMSAAHFAAATGVKFSPVQYMGGNPAAQSILVGETQVMFASSVTALPLIKAGRLRGLVVTLRRGSPSIPGIPGSEAAGLPGFESTFWFGLFAPAGTPRAAIDYINAEARKIFSAPDVNGRLVGMGLTVPLGTPEDFGKHVEAETKRWGEVIRKGNIKVEQ